MKNPKNFRIVRVPITTPTLYPNTETNSYLIGNNKESLLVDAGYDQGETKEILEKAIKEHNFATPNQIILTHGHPDHAPGVKQLIHWSPTVYCHEKELEVVQSAITPIHNIKLLQDKQIVKIADTEIQILHTPGHTSGHLSLYIASRQILIAGDNIVSEGTTWIGPPDGDMSEYIDTLRQLQSLDMKKIGPGHGDWVTTPNEKIQFVLNRRMHRENQIIDLLKNHKELTSDKITELIYQNTIHPSVFEVANRTIEAHLIKLIKDGKVYKDGEIYSFSKS